MKKADDFSSAFSVYLVGVQGFEPWTLWSQTRCATGLRYTPKTVIITSEAVAVKDSACESA
jgi:hypothetical protein